jgi:quinoprotein glucose dehydrogenase
LTSKTRLLIAIAAFASMALVWIACVPTEYDFSGGAVDGWEHYGKDEGGKRYSRLDQINRENVGDLEVAWEYHTGDLNDGSNGGKKSTFQTTPVTADGLLYLTTVHGLTIALDPETGAEIWKHDPAVDRSVHYGEFASRGVATWEDPQKRDGDECRWRIVRGTIDARLFALDGKTGRPCQDFGDGAQVDLSKGISPYGVGKFGVTSAPVIIDDAIVVGAGIGDGGHVVKPNGAVRAFDVRSGALKWTWEPIPLKRQQPNNRLAVVSGAANVWAPMSIDSERNLVFVPTSSPSPDYFGGFRPGNNANADSVVALDAATGKVVWSFQIVHHNLWDYDVPAQPVLLNVRKNGREIAAVAQTTKMGFLFLLNRDTGEPIFPVEERPVPQTTIPGEFTSATQPYPTVPKPLVPTTLGPEDAWGLTPWDKGECRQLIENARFDGMYTPPGLTDTISYPGFAGGSNWGSLANDPGRGVVILNMNRLAVTTRLIPAADYGAAKANDTSGTEQYLDQTGAPFSVARKPLLSSLGLPCTKPPWGVLMAVDTSTGEKKWEVPFGTIRDLAPVPLPITYGVPNLGGPIATAGDLIFIAAAADDYLRAYDIDTGKELWRGRLPAGGQATPMTYRLSDDGRQFVVIAAGGHGPLGTRIGDSLVAYALPE